MVKKHKETVALFSHPTASRCFEMRGSGKSTLVGALMLATGAISDRDLVKRRKDLRTAIICIVTTGRTKSDKKHRSIPFHHKNSNGCIRDFYETADVEQLLDLEEGTLF